MNISKRLQRITGQVTDAARTHETTLKKGIDKAGDAVNRNTGGKHDHKVQRGRDTLLSTLGKVTGSPDSRPEAGREGPRTTPEDQPPTSRVGEQGTAAGHSGSPQGHEPPLPPDHPSPDPRP